MEVSECSLTFFVFVYLLQPVIRNVKIFICHQALVKSTSSPVQMATVLRNGIAVGRVISAVIIQMSSSAVSAFNLTLGFSFLQCFWCSFYFFFYRIL